MDDPAPLLGEFRRLRDSASPQQRGKGLEILVGRLFRHAHFRVEMDAGAAKPRQTDLVAERGRETFLIETKWTSRPASLNEVDALTSRLDNTHSAVIGVLVSVNGFTSGAINSVGARRQRPILLMDGKDLEEACARDADLPRLLRDKRDALLLDGKVLVGQHTRPQRRQSSSGRPQDGDAYLLLPDGSRVPWIAARGSFSGFTFSRALNDPDWVSAPGAGVTFDLPLSIHTAAGVTQALIELSALGWATGTGQWSIAQSETNWHGLGPASLAEALSQWKERYENAGKIHHTEQVVYQDACADGFYTLLIDIASSNPRIVWRADMSLQLSGIPLDLDPIRELCRTFDVQVPTRFRPRTEKTVNRVWLRRDRPTRVEPIAFVVKQQPGRRADREVMVCGLVVKNPYYEPASVTRALPDDMPRPLTETDLLLCDVGSWHQLGKKLKYRLALCEWAATSDALVARVVTDWIDPGRAARPGKPDRPPRPESKRRHARSDAGSSWHNANAPGNNPQAMLDHAACTIGSGAPKADRNYKNRYFGFRIRDGRFSDHCRIVAGDGPAPATHTNVRIRAHNLCENVRSESGCHRRCGRSAATRRRRWPRPPKTQSSTKTSKPVENPTGNCGGGHQSLFRRCIAGVATAS